MRALQKGGLSEPDYYTNGSNGMREGVAGQQMQIRAQPWLLVVCPVALQQFVELGFAQHANA